MKFCPACNSLKPHDMFYASKKPNRMQWNVLCKVCDRKKAALWRKNNPEKAKNHDRSAGLVRKYKITLESFLSILESQGYACKICGSRDPKNHNFSVDHDHTTGRVRGLLCNTCNLMLGMAQDDIAVLASAIKYLSEQ